MNTNRRKFITSTGAVAAGTAIGTLPLRSAYAQNEGSSTIKIGLVGCGGRGSGAANQALNVGGCKLVAMADMFKDRLESSLGNLKKSNPDSVEVAEDMKFVGFDAYKNVIEQCDLVILATPPGFRPIHFAEAIEKNKHVFMEKPVATDAAGINKVLEYAKIADEKKRKVVVGLQRHYQNSYREALKQVQEGLIGDITSGSVYWNGGGVWTRERQPGMSEMEYQCLNWYYFNWLCGDHITEQHVHNLDVANWFVGDYPVSANGMGGREVRTSNKHGQIYDHHAVEFTYPNGIVISSQCRHIPGCSNEVREEFCGTKGRLYLSGNDPYATDLKGEAIWRHRGKGDPNPYQVEHNELQAAIRNDTPLNNAYYGAKSTFTSILGRLATYTGKKMDSAKALASNFSIMPEKYALDADPPVMPDKDGNYPIAVPGQYKPF